MINAIWDSVLHSISDWEECVSKGKLSLEHNNKNVESILVDMSETIKKLKWHEYTLMDEKIKDTKKLIVLQYLENIIPMFSKEFDLKVCISNQYNGSTKKRKTILYLWVTQPYIDEQYILSLPKEIPQN
ncbi:hypothetical protein SteCoe_38791 [Stentor coeruleus]|uniref:Uncharacterized protein n=1 Tax=Stentor coeruleus TaxID=5963 RepID=A0A1R2AL06_9CILI|nr:hypothetical protein SteCoe_38791 [Stentor coeruleus]